MESIKYSVCVPVYNVEKYLSECINSVLAQDYDNFELILVDDGSTDGSGKICDEYALRDDRIKVIHKQNEGLLLTRRCALSHTTGDFIMFLDSDDWWASNLLSRITEIVNSQKCDMVIFNYTSVYPNESVCEPPIFDDGSVFEKDKKKELYQTVLFCNRLNPLCLKAVKREIVDVDKDYSSYADVFSCEDFLQSIPMILNSQKTVYIADNLYFYRRGTGVTSRIRVDLMLGATKARYSGNQIIKKNSEFDLDDAYRASLCSYYNSLARKIFYGYLDDAELLKDTFEKIKEHPLFKEAEQYSKDADFMSRFAIYLAKHNMWAVVGAVAKLLKLRLWFKKKGEF